MPRADDARLIEELLAEGLLPGEERWVSHDLSFPMNPDGALAAYQELGPDPFADLDEELTGDGYWHMVAFRRHEITLATLRTIRLELEMVAAKHGGNYNGWILTYRGRRGEMLPRDGDPIFGRADNPNPFG